MQTMNDVFSRLSADDQKILISLPYRVGLYVSFSDVTGGWDAQEKELQSLTDILREFSEDYCKTEFSQKVLMESLQSRGEWPSWSQRIEKLPEEADHIVGRLQSIFPEKELYAFKEVLVDIALAVAMAFRENTEEEAAQKQSLHHAVRNALGRLAGKKASDPLEHVSISRNEREALSRLCVALHFTRR